MSQTLSRPECSEADFKSMTERGAIHTWDICGYHEGVWGGVSTPGVPGAICQLRANPQEHMGGARSQLVHCQYLVKTWTWGPGWHGSVD